MDISVGSFAAGAHNIANYITVFEALKNGSTHEQESYASAIGQFETVSQDRLNANGARLAHTARPRCVRAPVGTGRTTVPSWGTIVA